MSDSTLYLKLLTNYKPTNDIVFLKESKYCLREMARWHLEPANE